jgi:hypothetical protein
LGREDPPLNKNKKNKNKMINATVATVKIPL